MKLGKLIVLVGMLAALAVAAPVYHGELPEGDFAPVYHGELPEGD